MGDNVPVGLNKVVEFNARAQLLVACGPEQCLTSKSVMAKIDVRRVTR
jgi:hypothetical protein